MSGHHTEFKVNSKAMETTFVVGDLIRPKVNFMLTPRRTLGEYLEYEYRVDLNLPLEITKKYGSLCTLKQGVKNLGIWELNKDRWELWHTIVDYDGDDDQCV